jgi:hypothetical protein
VVDILPTFWMFQFRSVLEYHLKCDRVGDNHLLIFFHDCTDDSLGAVILKPKIV